MTFQAKKYYSEDFNKDNYINVQISRHKAKAYKKRVDEEYKICAREISGLIDSDTKMICLGTRNNHERDVFEGALLEKNVKVFSQDIAEASKADYIGDFNELSKFVPCDWDIIYSNSIDHAVDAENAFFEWIKVIKPGGIMVLGFSFDHGISPSDCNSFNEIDVDLFMKNSGVYSFIKSFNAIDYKYWVVTKNSE